MKPFLWSGLIALELGLTVLLFWLWRQLCDWHTRFEKEQPNYLAQIVSFRERLHQAGLTVAAIDAAQARLFGRLLFQMKVGIKAMEWTANRIQTAGKAEPAPTPSHPA